MKKKIVSVLTASLCALSLMATFPSLSASATRVDGRRTVNGTTYSYFTNYYRTYEGPGYGHALAHCYVVSGYGTFQTTLVLKSTSSWANYVKNGAKGQTNVQIDQVASNVTGNYYKGTATFNLYPKNGNGVSVVLNVLGY